MPNHPQDSLGSSSTQGDEDSGLLWVLAFCPVVLCYHVILLLLLNMSIIGRQKLYETKRTPAWLEMIEESKLNKFLLKLLYKREPQLRGRPYAAREKSLQEMPKVLYNEAKRVLEEFNDMENNPSYKFCFNYLSEIEQHKLYKKLSRLRGKCLEEVAGLKGKEKLFLYSLRLEVKKVVSSLIMVIKEQPKVFYNEASKAFVELESIKYNVNYNASVNRLAKSNRSEFDKLDEYKKQLSEWRVERVLTTEEGLRLCLEIKRSAQELTAKIIAASSHPFDNHARLSQSSTQPAAPTGILTDAALALSAESNIRNRT